MHQKTCAVSILLLAGALLFAPCAWPQSSEGDRSDSVFDRIQDLINRLGEKTEEFLAPHLGSSGDFGEDDWAGLSSHSRTIEYSSGVLRQDAIIDFASELAEAHVRIETWENPIAQLTAEITVGAETADAAAALAEKVAINISESPAGDQLDIRPHYPDTRASGRVNITAHFTLKVPSTVAIQCRNSFGDTSISGIGGGVVLNSRFGVVDLRDIGGRVQVQAWGEFNLRAHGLRGGGSFDLQSTIAEFTNCAGELQVNSFLGSVSVSDMPADAQVRLKGESGTLTCVVPDGANPSVHATALYGAIHSDLELERSAQGGLQIGQATPAEPSHQVVMDALFADVTVRRESGFVPVTSPSVAGDVNTYNSKEHSYAIAENAQIRIDAVSGNVRVRGGDDDRLIVKVTRRVRVDAPEDARMALEALAFRHEQIDGRTILIANVSRDMESLGVSSYRVDLDVSCPRSASVEVFAEDGTTHIEHIEGSVRIEQDRGVVNVENVRTPEGAIDIVNENGDVNVLNATGTLSIIAAQGAVQTRDFIGKQDIRTDGGNTLLESPAGDITVRHQSGNVRVLALGGVEGNWSVEVIDGDIGMLVPPSAHVVYYITYENGAVFPKIPLDGTIEGQGGSFRGRLNDATYRIDLRSKNGNIYLD